MLIHKVLSCLKRMLWMLRAQGLHGKVVEMAETVALMEKQLRILSANAWSRAHVQGHMMFLDPADSIVSPYLLRDGFFELAETILVENHVKPGDVVVDVGANIGYYTLILARLVGTTGRVYAFEPDPKNFALLQKNVVGNRYRNVTLIPCAVTEKSGRLKLFLCDTNKGDHRIYPSEECRAQVEIQGVSLDDYLNAKEETVDFVKMDIQGSEPGALRGMRRIIQRSPKLKMVTEFWPRGMKRFGASPDEFLDELRELGFDLSVIGEDGLPRSTGDKELLAVNQGNAEAFTNLFCDRSRSHSSARPEAA